MKIRIWLYALLLAFTGVFSACNSEEEEPLTAVGQAGVATIYGHEFHLASALLTQRNDYEVYETIPYTWTHTYTDAKGNVVETPVNGVAIGENGVKAGYFTLTLFDPNVGYNETTQDLSGSGLCLTVHFATEKSDVLPTGDYMGSETPTPGTFKAYYSTRYSTGEPNLTRVMPITEGTITVTSLTADHITLAFNMKSPVGTDIKGTYDGSLRQKDGRTLSLITGTDLKLYGYTSDVHAPYYLVADPSKMLQDNIEKGYGLLSCLINVSGSKTATPAVLLGTPELGDVLLAWDADKKVFRLMPPVSVPISYKAFNWSSFKYEDKYAYFTNYTKFMKAPASFGEAQYNDLDNTGISFTMEEETVEFAPGETGYAFFETCQGVKGVIHFKTSFDPETVRVPYSGPYEYHIDYPGGFMIDFKATASPVVPQIG